MGLLFLQVKVAGAPTPYQNKEIVRAMPTGLSYFKNGQGVLHALAGKGRVQLYAIYCVIFFEVSADSAAHFTQSSQMGNFCIAERWMYSAGASPTVG